MPVQFFRSSKEGRSPAVFLVHGTSGPDARTQHRARFFNERGYHALVVDFKTGRFTGPEDRMRLNPYPLIEYAREWLVQQPGVDPVNLVWMGMSLGGALGLITEQSPWSAFILFYPSCWNFTKTESPKPPRYWAFHVERPRIRPTLIVYGQADEYQEARYCPEMLKLMTGPVEVLELEGAHHGFDGNTSVSYRDASSPSGRSSVRPSAEARAAAEQKIRSFLQLPR